MKSLSFTLRPWREQDAQSIYALANNQKIADNLRDVFPFPYSLQDAVHYVLESQNAPADKVWLCAIDVDGKAVGSIGVFRQADVYCRSAEIGYWLGEPYWGQGLMTRAVLQMVDRIFSETDIVRIHAEVFAYNAPSKRVLEKAGFHCEGLLRQSIYKNGRLHDSYMMARIKTTANYNTNSL